MLCQHHARKNHTQKNSAPLLSPCTPARCSRPPTPSPSPSPSPSASKVDIQRLLGERRSRDEAAQSPPPGEEESLPTGGSLDRQTSSISAPSSSSTSVSTSIPPSLRSAGSQPSLEREPRTPLPPLSASARSTPTGQFPALSSSTPIPTSVPSKRPLPPPSPASATATSGTSPPPAKKQSKWSPDEDALIIRLRGDGMKWEDISKHLPGRSAISCRLHYQNYLERRSEWDEERRNKLARLYERFKPEMWSRVAEELSIPWRAAEAMHWQLGEAEMARRAGVVPFTLANTSTTTAPTSTPTASAAYAGSRGGHVRSRSQGTGQRRHPHPQLHMDTSGSGMAAAAGGRGPPPGREDRMLPSVAELTRGVPAFDFEAAPRSAHGYPGESRGYVPGGIRRTSPEELGGRGGPGAYMPPGPATSRGGYFPRGGGGPGGRW
ncbi:MAG: hypothetical protein Q9227_004675 [Pyrenula ochraceoflavens]